MLLLLIAGEKTKLEIIQQGWKVGPMAPSSQDEWMFCRRRCHRNVRKEASLKAILVIASTDEFQNFKTGACLEEQSFPIVLCGNRSKRQSAFYQPSSQCVHDGHGN
jgi:hypothetical protein